MIRRLTTPYADLLPPLTTEEFEALRADIMQNGMLQSVLIDERDNILDGHHRYRIDRNAKTKIIHGLTDEEKEATAQALAKARGFLQKDLGAALKLRFTPHLTFALDSSIDEGMKIDNILKKIHDEKEVG